MLETIITSLKTLLCILIYHWNKIKRMKNSMLLVKLLEEINFGLKWTKIFSLDLKQWYYLGTYFKTVINGKICLKRNYLWKFNVSVIILFQKMTAAAKSFQSCPTLCDPRDGSPPGYSIHGIFQARVLQWGAIAENDYFNPYQKSNLLENFKAARWRTFLTL